MTSETAAPDRSKRGIPSPRRTAAVRGLAFLALWLVLLPSTKLGDLAIGILSVAAAAFASMKLLPPATGSLNFDALLLLAPHFLWESVKAGVDVARRALAPRPRLAPGFVNCPLDFPPGFARNTFATITSMMPGTVPSGEDNEKLVYHCLDTAEPIVEQLWKEEELLARALVAGRRHD
jgi:multicomponent Na+:H+ antiporter subunit E